MDLKILATTFATLFLAEMGDKTQLACILMAAKTGRPWTVLLGAALALTAVSAVGVIFATVLSEHISPAVIKKIAAVGFVAMGVLIYFDRL